MKSSAKRRRSKKQIEKEKEEEERRQADIALKLAHFDQMQAAVEEMQDKCQRIDNVDHAVQQLSRSGLIKQMGHETFQAVQTWEEHNQLVQERQEELKLGEQLAQ